MVQSPIFWVILTLAGFIAGYFVRKYLSAKKEGSIEQIIKKRLEEAEFKAKEIVVEGQKKAVDFVEEAKKEERERKIQFSRTEERLLKKEESLEKQWNDIRFQENQIKEDVEKIKSSKNYSATRKKTIPRLI